MPPALIACRLCGVEWPLRSHRWIIEGGGCPSCEGSPLCDNCGHPRRDHVRVFVDGGERQCQRRIGDFQTLTSHPCSCPAYEPVRGPLSKATFAQPDPEPEGPIPSLRVELRG